MLKRILPSGVAVAEAYDDPADARLYPQEAALVVRALPERQREFTTVRHCARLAMAELGLPVGPVLPGLLGAPRWPDAAVGSLTHCLGYRGAALAHASDIATLGIDAEPNGPLPDGVLAVIALPDELRAVASLIADRPQMYWVRLLFSAKESVYKAWYPYTAQPLDYGDADIRFDPQAGTFTAALLAPPPQRAGGDAPLPGRLESRWLAEGGLVVTAIGVRADPDARSSR